MIKVYCLFLFCVTLAFSQSPVPAGAKLEKIAVGLLQPEGPVWVDSLGLLFSDIQGNEIYRWSPSDSALKTFMKPSDSSNGLTLDLQGRLILTQMELRRVSRRETDGTITPLVSTYMGKRFNSPNDVVVKSDGFLYFTDPDFNIPPGQKAELTIHGIYRLSPSGDLTVLDTTFDKPNGICFSPDEKKFYVNESHECKIYVWDVTGDSIFNKKLFYSIPSNITGYMDGMKADPAGNIYCTGPTGVWVISPEGALLDRILFPSPDNSPSNCNWGDADRKTLYITSGKSLYRIRLAPTTGVHDHGDLVPNSFKLYQNYPNPFNPATMISYEVPVNGKVSLAVYDLLGREVAELVNGVQKAGDHAVQWDAAHYSSGVYFCRLWANDFVKTEKIVLVK
ncbi:MAG TPA: SMP-30/gluconolactonase/LRE family protein [Bacteroidota bacterium]|nr:SMP-30/gluconolactonase/LRE family protein [Bacteroidota bacterium]